VIKIVSVILSSLILSACAQVNTGLMVVEKGVDEPLMGKATSSMSGGKFEASNAKGLSCSGDYASMSESSPIINVNFSCNDGRTGTAKVLRSGSMFTDGSGVGTLSDGKEIKIFLGSKVNFGGAESYWDKK